MKIIFDQSLARKKEPLKTKSLDITIAIPTEYPTAYQVAAAFVAGMKALDYSETSILEALGTVAGEIND